MPYPIYRLQLHKTYYEKGFFNLGVDVEKFVTRNEGSVILFLGDTKMRLDGRMSRKSNLNTTPRIFGGAELRNWFWKNYKMNEIVEVVVLKPTEIWLKTPNE